MSKFKVGDKVICVKNTPEVQEGWIGIVFAVAAPCIGAEYNLVAQNGTGFYAFHSDELELIKRDDGDIKPEDIQGIHVSALDKQVSGNHYKDCGIQPIEYIHANGLNYFEGNAVKYITRHRKKNGKADIEKAIHYLELLLEMEYKEQ